MSVAHRAQIFLRFHDLVLQRQVQLLDLIQLESGKARVHAFEEVADTAIVSRHYARRAAGYLRPRRRQGAFPLLSQAVELRHPKGVVGIVAPWKSAAAAGFAPEPATDHEAVAVPLRSPVRLTV